MGFFDLSYYKDLSKSVFTTKFLSERAQNKFKYRIRTQEIYCIILLDSNKKMSNNPSEEPFYKLLKDSFSYNKNKESTEKKTITDYYSTFKDKTNMFRQRIKPDETQKKEIMNNVLENNINYIYNTEILPKEKLKVTYLQDAPRIIIEDEPHQVLSESESHDTVVISSDGENQRLLSPTMVQEFSISPKGTENDFRSYMYQKHKERQPTLAEILAKSKKIQKKTDNLVEVDFHHPEDDIETFERRKGENGQRIIMPQTVTQRRVSPIPKPRDTTKEDQLAKLKNDLKALTQEKHQKIKKERDAEEEMRRKAVTFLKSKFLTFQGRSCKDK